ncbi:MAG TPA: hypothetical protein VL400_03020, partial [Polyangiaceae bacterium]|nr:hypothetical protein [Polyangiaceae bacterium]
GAAHLADLSTTVTAGAIGTFAYMSPEQRLGRPATVASDLYAAGALLYEMLTGIPAEPTPDGHFVERPPSAYHDDLLATHDAIVGAMLADDPALRPADAFEARRRLESVPWSRRALPRHEGGAASTRSSRPPPEAVRLGPARDLGDGRDVARLAFDTRTSRHVLVVPLDDTTLAFARGFARADDPSLPLVLRASKEDAEIWVEPPRGASLADAPPSIDVGPVLSAAIARLHAAGGAHGALDAQHLYVHEGCLVTAWPRRLADSIDEAKRRDLAALETLVGTAKHGKS